MEELHSEFSRGAPSYAEQIAEGPLSQIQGACEAASRRFLCSPSVVGGQRGSKTS